VSRNDGHTVAIVAALDISPAGDLVLAGTGKTTTKPLAMTGERRQLTRPAFAVGGAR
jgi:hypothetical protein